MQANSKSTPQSALASSGIDSSVLLENAIVARGVRMVFKTGNEPYCVLQKIDLEIARGTMQFLMGPSGVGKTTLLFILAGILTPTAGEVYLMGEKITHCTKPNVAKLRLQKTGFIFQDLNLLSALTTLENIEIALRLKGLAETNARREARILLAKVGLAEKADKLPRSLSGGEKQRVAIARGLAGYPPILFADEPTSALDSRNARTVVELLQNLAHEHGSTVLMATHDHRFTNYADRIWRLENGTLE